MSATFKSGSAVMLSPEKATRAGRRTVMCRPEGRQKAEEFCGSAFEASGSGELEQPGPRFGQPIASAVLVRPRHASHIEGVLTP
jgi:hypothetical protein